MMPEKVGPLCCFCKKQKRHGRPAGRNRDNELNALERVPFHGPFVQYPFNLFIGHRARFDNFVRHVDIIEKELLFFNICVLNWEIFCCYSRLSAI